MKIKNRKEDSESILDEDRIKKIVALSREENAKSTEKYWSIKEIFALLDRTIVGNSAYKKSLAVTLGDFLSENHLRGHMLVMGPSGSGKTYLLDKALPELNIPYCILDMSSLVPSGYKGATLSELLQDFYSRNRSDKCNIIVVDEFDKISTHANGDDAFKSQSIQSELLTLIQGKKEGKIDTHNALWIMVGAFAYVDEFKSKDSNPSKNQLLKYGFKNELLGRIVKMTNTEPPSLEEMVRIISKHEVTIAFVNDFQDQHKKVSFEDRALLRLAEACFNTNFGIRTLPTVFSYLKEHFTFMKTESDIIVSHEVIESILKKI